MEIEVTLNDTALRISSNSTIKDLLTNLESKGLQTQGVAVAVNGAVVRREKWPEQKLSAADRILLVTASQGG